MIARGVFQGSLCLGCHFRLLQQSSRLHISRSPRSRPIASARGFQRWVSGDAFPHTQRQERFDKRDSIAALEEQANEHQHSRVHDEDHLPEADELPNSRPPPKPRREDNFRPWKKLDLRKRHLSGRRILEEKTERLDSDMLGKPAYAIIMKDGGRFHRKNVPADPEDLAEATEARELLDIEALLDSQSVPPTDTEVRDNINELRPKTDTVLSAKAFQRVQQELEDGFLKTQLSNYLESFKTQSRLRATVSNRGEASSNSVDSDPPSAQHKWIKKRGPWVPLGLDGNALQGMPGHELYGYMRPKASVKERLAVRIMRECWGLQIQELISGPGETNITLHNREFILLTRGTRRIFRLLNNIYLEPGETIDVVRDKSMLRIVAPQLKSQTIIDQLDVTLQNIKTGTLNISSITPDPSRVTEVLLEEVGRITNTHVGLSQNGKRLHVTWIEARNREEFQTEDLRHIVFRLLVTALQPDDTVQKLYFPDRSSDGREGRFLVDNYNTEQWAWKDKLKDWARYVLPQLLRESNEIQGSTPASLENSSAEEVQGVIRDHELNLEFPVEGHAGMAKQASEAINTQSGALSHTLEELHPEVTSPPDRRAIWSCDESITTQAKFGHILHTNEGQALSSPSSVPSENRKHPHIFSSIVPHPVQLASLDSAFDREADHPILSTILIRFRPTSDLTDNASTVAPHLELRLSLSEPTSTSDDPAILGVHSLRAVTTTHIHDVMLPSSPVDVRFVQTRYTTLIGTPDDIADWKPIRDFLDKAHLDLRASKLEFPPDQRFQIPARLFSAPRGIPGAGARSSPQKETGEPSRTNSGAQSPKAGPADDTLRSVMYDFMGLELHRSVSVQCPGDARFTMIYTSIEAGQGGGRRAELSISPTALSPEDPAAAATTASDEGAADAESASAVRADGNTVVPKVSLTELLGREDRNDYIRACYNFARSEQYWNGHHADGEGQKL